MDGNFGFARLTRVGAATMSMSLTGVASALAAELYRPGDNGALGAPYESAVAPHAQSQPQAAPDGAASSVDTPLSRCRGSRAADPFGNCWRKRGPPALLPGHGGGTHGMRRAT